MRILFVSDTYYPHVNGVYYFVCRMAPMLQDKGHKVAVIAPSETFAFTKKKIDNLDVFGLPSFSTLLYRTIRIPLPFSITSRLTEIVSEFKPDVIHVQDHFAISKKIIELNKQWQIPIIGTNHFMPENMTVLLKGKQLKAVVTEWLWKGFAKIYNQVDIVTTPTETGVSYIQPLLDVKAIAISCGIDLEAFNTSGNTDRVRKKYDIPNKPILLYVGRLDPEKRVDEIIRAVAVALREIDFCFVVVGKGNSKKLLEELSQKLGISDNVLFTGFVADEDLPYVYKTANCFVIASIAELLSLVTLQAMAAALPVIAVNAGALSELVNDGMNGYLYHEGDIKKLVASIKTILADKDLQSNMGSKSLEYVQKHDINKVLLSFEKLYAVYSKKQNAQVVDSMSAIN